MSSQIYEGLFLGLFGMLLTIVILFVLGFVIYLFKFFNLSPKVEAVEEVKSYETETLLTNKKMVAISVALAKYFSEKQTKGAVKVAPTQKTFVKSLKEKRWRNG